jgi:hypothetical protein
MQKVWASTDELFVRADASLLDKPVLVKPIGEMPAIRALGQICLSHGIAHFGEIELTRTLIGVGAAIGI